MLPPLRAVVLDNDETTGSYGLVFALMNYLRMERQPSLNTVATILEKLAMWMVGHDVFRPGLDVVLETLLSLRKAGSIDVIIMYTNQSELVPPGGYPDLDTRPPFLWSVPNCIAFMMNYIMNDLIFNAILTRPLELKTQKGIVAKRFSRILDLYSQYPKDTHNMLFVDDCATTEYVLDTDIPDEGRYEKARYQVSQYFRCLKPEEVFSCLLFCFEDINVVNEMFPSVYSMYHETMPQKDTSARDQEFMILTQILRKKYSQV
jgi:hypothetical protein